MHPQIYLMKLNSEIYTSLIEIIVLWASTSSIFLTNYSAHTEPQISWHSWRDICPRKSLFWSRRTKQERRSDSTKLSRANNDLLTKPVTHCAFQSLYCSYTVKNKKLWDERIIVVRKINYREHLGVSSGTLCLRSQGTLFLFLFVYGLRLTVRSSRTSAFSWRARPSCRARIAPINAL